MKKARNNTHCSLVAQLALLFYLRRIILEINTEAMISYVARCLVGRS